MSQTLEFEKRLKENPELINDEIFLSRNKNELSFSQIPENIRNNILFTVNFFRQKRTTEEISLINLNFFKNKLFINDIIFHNPEIYLKLDNELKEYFKDSMLNTKKYLKYFKKEDLHEEKVIQHILNNLNYFETDDLKYIDSSIFTKLLISNILLMNSYLKTFSYEKLKALSEPIKNYISQLNFKDNIQYIGNLLKNTDLYSVIYDIDKNDDFHKVFEKEIKEITLKKHYYYQYLPNYFYDDTKFIKGIIKEHEKYDENLSSLSKSKIIGKIINKYLSLKGIDALNELNLNYSLLISSYPYFDISLKKDEKIIKNLFNEKKMIKINKKVIESLEIDDDVKNNLKGKLVKNSEKHRTLLNLADEFQKIIHCYYIEKKIKITNQKINKI